MFAGIFDNKGFYEYYSLGYAEYSHRRKEIFIKS